jgi:hypothetical protein
MNTNRLFAFSLMLMALASACSTTSPQGTAEQSTAPAAHGSAAPSPSEGSADSVVVEPAEQAPVEGSSGEGTRLVTEFAPAGEGQNELFELAADAMRAGRQDAAITALLTLSETAEPSEVRGRGMLLLAAIYLEQERHDQVMRVLSDLRASAPPMAQLEYMLGLSHEGMGDIPAATTSLRNATRIDSAYLPPYIELIRVFQEHDRPADAEEISILFERQVARMGEELDSSAPKAQKQAVLERLAEVQPDERVSRAAARGVDDEDDQVALYALAALVQIGTPSAIPTLRAIVENPRSADHAQLATVAMEYIETRAAQAPTVTPGTTP